MSLAPQELEGGASGIADQAFKPDSSIHMPGEFQDQIHERSELDRAPVDASTPGEHVDAPTRPVPEPTASQQLASPDDEMIPADPAQEPQLSPKAIKQSRFGQIADDTAVQPAKESLVDAVSGNELEHNTSSTIAEKVGHENGSVEVLGDSPIAPLAEQEQETTTRSNVSSLPAAPQTEPAQIATGRTATSDTIGEQLHVLPSTEEFQNEDYDREGDDTLVEDGPAESPREDENLSLEQYAKLDAENIEQDVSRPAIGLLQSGSTHEAAPPAEVQGEHLDHFDEVEEQQEHSISAMDLEDNSSAGDRTFGEANTPTPLGSVIHDSEPSIQHGDSGDGTHHILPGVMVASVPSTASDQFLKSQTAQVTSLFKSSGENAASSVANDKEPVADDVDDGIEHMQRGNDVTNVARTHAIDPFDQAKDEFGSALPAEEEKSATVYDDDATSAIENENPSLDKLDLASPQMSDKYLPFDKHLADDHHLEAEAVPSDPQQEMVEQPQLHSAVSSDLESSQQHPLGP